MQAQAPLTSGVIPTIGRPEHLRRSLASLCRQTVPLAEVVIVDSSRDGETAAVANDSCWSDLGLTVRYFQAPAPNAASQRNLAAAQTRHPYLMFLEDDAEYSSDWIEQLIGPLLADSTVAATVGRITNQPYEVCPSPLWRLYHWLVCGRSPEQNQGRLVGAALLVGYSELPSEPSPVEWLGGGFAAVRKDAFNAVGGFASYFEGPSPHEDLDLGYRLSRRWRVLLVPTATCTHHNANVRRFPASIQHYHSMRSKYAVQHCAMGRSIVTSLVHTAIWAAFQGLSEVIACRKRPSLRFLANWYGRAYGWLSCLAWRPSASPHQVSASVNALPHNAL
jgi:GT2 family glycosyltransferase